MIYGKMKDSKEDRFWAKIGFLQFDFMLKQGLKPNHYLLDIGCGPLRGGIYFVFYLKEGHYFGVDADPEALKVARKFSRKIKKKIFLLNSSTFEFEKLNQIFDYALAQGVFCHLRDEEIILCLKKVSEVLKLGGKFYASYFDGGNKPQTRLIGFRKPRTTFRTKNPFHQPFKFYKRNTPNNLKVRYIGKWKHPRDLRMLEFVKVRKK